MAPSAPGQATQPPVPPAISSGVSEWCARLALGSIALVLAIQTLLPGSPGLLVGRTMPAGSAIVLGLLATAVLAALRGRTRLARTAGLVSVLLGALLTLMAGLTLAGVTGPAVGEVTAPGWRTAGHAATVHVLLGVALLATLRPFRRLVPLRLLGLATGVLAPLASLSARAVRGEGAALLPGIPSLTLTVAIATPITTCAIAALAPDRWPLRTLLRHPSDQALVGRLLPFVLLLPFVAPFVVAVARTAGLDERPTLVLATLLPMLGLFGLLAVTVRGHRRLLAEIATRDRQLLTVLDGLPVAVMVRAQDGTLLHFNPGTEAFIARLGVGPEAIRGSASDLMAHVAVVDEDERPYDRERLPVVSAVRDGRTHDATVGHALPDGGYAWYSVRAAPLPLNDGTSGTIVTLDDVTEQQDARLRITVAERALRRLNGELNQANVRLEEAAQFKDDLLSMASHELRTPLTPILGFLEILEARGDLTTDQQQLLEVVGSNAKRMLRLVDDFLAVGRASAGALVGQPQDVSVDAALRGALQEMGDVAGPVDLAVAGCRAIVDPQHLEQIVLNLLTNATKYGTPPVTVTAKRAGEGRIALEVADHGAGVPPEFQQHMWDRFVQKDRGDRRTATGVGLGLSIVSLLAEANDGTISYRDGSPTGAVFTVELPGTFQPDPTQTPTGSTTRQSVNAPSPGNSVPVSEKDTLAASAPVGQPPQTRPGTPPRSDDGRTEKDLLEQLAEIAHRLSEADGVDDLLQLIVDLGEDYLEGCDGASLMLIGKDRTISSPAYSSRVAYESDLAQYQADGGPCLDALRDHAVYLIDDLENEQRWPQYRAAALKLGVRSMLSYRLYAKGQTYGALDFYAKRPNVYSPFSKVIGQVFASHAGVALKGAITEAGMEKMIESRDIIGQARGMLMERRQLSPADAFGTLTALSRDTNTSVRDIAERITSGEIPA